MAYSPLPDAPTFTLAPPKAPPVADFGFAFAQDPMAQEAYKFRLAQGRKGMERDAASHGSLLTGGTAKALEEFRQGLASQEYDKSFGRAMDTYRTNRDTGQLNFGNANSAYDRSRSAFEGDRGFSLDRARIEDARRRADAEDTRYAQDFDYRKSRDAVGDARYASETGYAHGRDAQDFDYRKSRDAAGDTRYADELAYGHGRDALGDRRYADDTTYAHGRDATSDQRYADELAYGRARTAWLDTGSQGQPYGSYPAPGFPSGGKPRFSLAAPLGAPVGRRPGAGW